jgi:hypothetical protein
MFKKTKPDTRVISAIVVITGLISFFGSLYIKDIGTMKQNLVDSSFHVAVIEKPTHIDSLPYYQYKIVNDSLETIAKIEKDRNTLHPMFLTLNIGFWGVTKTNSYWYDWYGDKKSHMDEGHFILLPNYKLDNRYDFKYRDHKYFFSGKKGNLTEIKVAYLPASSTVLVPVSENFYKIASVVLLVVLMLWGIFAFFVAIILPINLLVNISKGKVFTKRNIRSLYLLAYTTFAYIIIQLVAPYIVCLFFLKKIPSELSISFSAIFNDEVSDLIIGIILLAIASAFAKGYKLQQEQDLTI